MKSYLLILSGNLSTTPRAKKVLTAIKESENKVDLLLVNRGISWYEKDKEILSQFPNVSAKWLNISRERLLSWVLLTCFHQLMKLCWVVFPHSYPVSALASNKSICKLFLFLFFKRNRDFTNIIAFSGAFFPADFYSRRLNIGFKIDVEDYHPGELYAINDPKEQARREIVLRHSMERAEAISFSSPLIREKSLELNRNSVNSDKSIVFPNSFPSDEFLIPKLIRGDIRFVWFSQTISYGRGLELFIEAANQFKWNGFNLTLIGDLSNDFAKEYKILSNESITHFPSISQEKLHQKISEYDIGLAIDLSSTDINRELALTNKIFAYYQAGLYSIITNTKAQELFQKQNSLAGILTKQEVNAFQSSLDFILNNIVTIRDQKIIRFNKAKELSFEKYADLIKEKLL